MLKQLYIATVMYYEKIRLKDHWRVNVIKPS